MADHRAEQIMDAFTTLVTGLTTASNNVKRDRAYDVESGVTRGITVLQGPDEPIQGEDSVWPFIDSVLTIYTDIRAVDPSTTAISQTLNQIRKEMVIAIIADHKLGLLFVHEIEEGTADAPDIEPGEKPIATQRIEWNVKYRRSITDPSA